MTNKIASGLLLKGSNRVIEIEDIVLEKDYNAECASGFYLIRDINIAKYYARKLTNLYGGTPIINIYKFDFNKVKKVLENSYFNELNEKSMRYIGENLKEILPKDCPRQDGGLPRELCHTCLVKNCERNADYIEAILSEGGYYNLDDILIDLIDDKIDDDEAILRINEELRKENLIEIPIQFLLREKAINEGLRLIDYKEIPLINENDENVENNNLIEYLNSL